MTVAFVAEQLAFVEQDKCVEWLTGLEGPVYVEAGTARALTAPTVTALLDCKSSAVNF